MTGPRCVCCGEPAGEAPPLTIGHVCDGCLFMSWRNGVSVAEVARLRGVAAAWAAEPATVGLDALRAWGALRAAWLARAEGER